mmetsp:Transcript_38933/g.90152  ORF Transcript_38933/g.90152 Transcript_38933/m.90152 type:complete len:235 (+) Transcript_38933:862-1566(+)
MSPMPVMLSKLAGFDSGVRVFCVATSTNSFARRCSLEVSAEPTAHHSASSASARSCSRSAAIWDPGSARRSLPAPSPAHCGRSSAGSSLRRAASQAVDMSTSNVTRRPRPASDAAQKASRSCAQASSSAHGHTSAEDVTLGLPEVRVPVLSSTTHFTLDPSSSGMAPDRTRIPHFAATPVAAMTAVGVARPSAQGQATKSTVRPCSSTKKALSSSGMELSRPRRIDSNDTVLVT